jgi:hypothetical protein
MIISEGYSMAQVSKAQNSANNYLIFAKITV